MPLPRRSNLSQQSRTARRIRNIANEMTEEAQGIAREELRVRVARFRASQSQEQRDAARETARLAMRNRRANNRDQQVNNFRRIRRDLPSADLNRAAFRYNCSTDYCLHPSVCIGRMDVVCEYCGALKFSGETSGLCCLSGKVKLPLLTPSPEPLHSLLCGETPESRHFLANTQKYNGCFQMTSFGSNIIEERGFNPTFKVYIADYTKKNVYEPEILTLLFIL